MGLDLAQNFAIAKAVFDEVDATLGQNLSTLMFSGNADELTQTQNAQPAIMAVSLAVLRILESETGETIPNLCSYVAGHSLGEYSALCAAGVFNIATAAKLLRARGLAMAAAGEKTGGAMAAVLGLTVAQAQELADQAAAPNEFCVLANDNCPGQVVLSGHPAAIARATELGQQMGARKVVKLPVSGAFHSQLMQPAADEMAAILADMPFAAPSVPVVMNVTAAPDTDPNILKALLVQQITGRVRWTESIQWLASQDVKNYIECGNGKVLAGLIGRTQPDAQIISLGTYESLKAYLEG